MADNEWYQIEAEDGRVVAAGMTQMFTNPESAADAARTLAPDRPEGVLAVVKYTRTAIKTFTKTISVVEADVPPPA